MLDFQKEILILEKERENIKEKIELIKNFDSFDLVKKFEIAKDTNLKYQRDELVKNLMKDFKSEAIRNCDTAKIGVNYFTIRIDYIEILIPIYNYNLIAFKDVSNSRLVKQPLKDTSVEVKMIAHIKEKIRNLSLLNVFDRKNQKLILERYEKKLNRLIAENEKIEKENKLIDEKIKRDEEIVLSAMEDLRLFEENGYAFKYDLALFLNN